MEITEVRYARQDPSLVVLENFHAIKHALRFGGHLLGAWTADLEQLRELEADLASDIHIPAELIDADILKQHSPRGQVIAVARHPVQPGPEAILEDANGHIVLLENPAHLGNLGAVVRVAAAAGAAAVMTTGRQDPWHADALRGSAGLHFAVPVHRLPGLPDTGPARRPLIALDPDGDPLSWTAVPQTAVLAFGTERHGLSEHLLDRADARLALPMAPGVSSMNLATAVAATLYALKLSAPDATQRA